MEDKVVMTSKKFTLDWRDVIKGVILAALAAGVAVAVETYETGSLNFDWHLIGKAAIYGGVGYIIKNFFTPAEIKTPAEKTT
jgi:hypothetical protein